VLDVETDSAFNAFIICSVYFIAFDQFMDDDRRFLLGFEIVTRKNTVQFIQNLARQADIIKVYLNQMFDTWTLLNRCCKDKPAENWYPKKYLDSVIQIFPLETIVLRQVKPMLDNFG